MDKELLEKDLAQFLSPGTREELKTVAVENVLGLTGTDEGKELLGHSEMLLQGIVSLTDDRRSDIKDMTYKCLINLSSCEVISWNILTLKKYEKKFSDWLKLVLDPKCKIADLVCKLLSNLTRSEKCAESAAKHVLDSEESGVEKIVMVLCNIVYNDSADLHYLGALLSNLSQAKEIRQKLMDKSRCLIQRLLPFTEFNQSAIRRRGIVGTLRNCCFDTEYHPWLLGEEVDILPRLLLPLAGGEEFDDDDMEKLPDDLQYLPPDKQREPQADIRKMLTEALLQLCATRSCKQIIKAKNTYVIMREYYAWERKQDPINEIAAMNLIDVLIGDEAGEEFGENLKEVEIPDDLQQKFQEEDTKELLQALGEESTDKGDESAEKGRLGRFTDPLLASWMATYHDPHLFRGSNPRGEENLNLQSSAVILQPRRSI